MSAGRIRVVDDDPQIRRVMRVALTGPGHGVDDVTTGETALDKLRERGFDRNGSRARVDDSTLRNPDRHFMTS
jgi:CheY-like chemotaxis protein